MSSLRPLQTPESLTVNHARQFLAQFICLSELPPLTDQEAQQVRDALRFLVAQSDFQTFGVCANSLDQGKRALIDYLAGLGHDVTVEVPAIAGPIYIKYNLKNGKCYADEYRGQARGVLVTCHGADEDAVNGTYGHLPLTLFEA